VLSNTLNNYLVICFMNATIKRYPIVTIEQFFGVLLATDKSIIEVLLACNVDISKLKQDLKQHIVSSTIVDEGEGQFNPEGSPELIGLIKRAERSIRTEGSKNKVELTDILISLFAEKNCPVLVFLENQGVSRLDVMNFIAAGVKKEKDS
jgi:ATP-dependent Clp protease ATP-binding subunit ClpA